eukprot:gnl/MRDRNA2_/MRDRNA2_80999_c0_seq2.p1 gnl/MRDRNA2_/MRDRNA2_80999_c0~~gnl/MRDRNA2_/MRDRNA2_80999_c0_seq2.p1  ORF type:complete len:221 (+),score=51.43 gnl/MRDRNA2_/MRDRNA2_80999_c0_seq2:115-777(+)
MMTPTVELVSAEQTQSHQVSEMLHLMKPIEGQLQDLSEGQERMYKCSIPELAQIAQTLQDISEGQQAMHKSWLPGLAQISQWEASVLAKIEACQTSILARMEAASLRQMQTAEDDCMIAAALETELRNAIAKIVSHLQRFEVITGEPSMMDDQSHIFSTPEVVLAADKDEFVLGMERGKVMERSKQLHKLLCKLMFDLSQLQLVLNEQPEATANTTHCDP